MNYEKLVVGALDTNCYLVFCQETRECAIVDPAADAENIFNLIIEKDFKPVVILNTHGHVDHVGANKDMKEKFNIPLHIHAFDSSMMEKAHLSGWSFMLRVKPSPPADILFEEGDSIRIGSSFLRVLHTPGHSPGSVSFIGDNFLLSGDTLFCQGVGRTDLPGGNWEDLMNSIKQKIFILPEETVVLPGHGPMTSVGQEKRINPFIK